MQLGSKATTFHQHTNMRISFFQARGNVLDWKIEGENPDVRPLRNVSKGAHLRADAANCFYPIFVKDKKIIGFGDVCADDFHPGAMNVQRSDGVLEVYPIARLVKVLRLESYEDALHNTFSDSNIERLSERGKAYRQGVGDEEYRIRYLVKLPLEASDSMLSLAKLEHPFEYTIETLSDYGPKVQTVDLVETFNWLCGLRVKRDVTWVNKADKTGRNKEGRLYRAIYGTDREGKERVLVVWRDMTGLDPVKDREFLEAKGREVGPFEKRWVNGDSTAKDFASLDLLFKRLMAGGET
jgi:adenine-specific DNA-methyltransferase